MFIVIKINQCLSEKNYYHDNSCNSQYICRYISTIVKNNVYIKRVSID